MTVAPTPRSRQSLDALVAQMGQPGFVARYGRPLALRERQGHVSPSILAQTRPRSRYVTRWRSHARRCLECAAAYRHFGLKLG